MCPGASGSFGMSLSDALRSSQLIPAMGVGPGSNKNIPDTRNALLRKQFANLFFQKQERTIFDVRLFLSRKILLHYCQGIFFLNCKTLLYSCTFIAHVYILKQNVNNEIRVHC